MTRPNQNDLEWLAARLSIATYDVNRTTPEMSFRELQTRFPELTGLSYAANGNQILHTADRTLEVGPMASDDEIGVALQNPFVRTENTKIMSITGLQQGAFQAKLAEMRQKVADSQANGLTKIDRVVTAGIAELDAAAEGAAAKANKEIADALQEFGLTTNGGPA